MLSTTPDQPGFKHGVGLAEAALAQGVDVYLYCIDDAVEGIGQLQPLAARGAKLYACASGAQRRGIAMTDQTTFAGLSVLSDLMSATDRFVSFN